MAKTIVVVGERLTEADQRVIERLRAGVGIGTLFSRAHINRLIARGLIERVTLNQGLTLHGKGVAAALAAYKEEVERG